METNSLSPPSSPAPLPPGTAAASPQAHSAPSRSFLPLPRLPARAGTAVARPGEAVVARLPFAASRLPAALGPSLAGALEARWKSYRKELGRCQENFSEDAVHELRVATRRLLAQFVLLGCVTPSAALDKARRMLKRRLAALGDLRDTHVQLGFVDQQAARFPDLEPLRVWLRRRERRLVRSAARKVNHFRTRKLAKWISTMTDDLAANAEAPHARKRLATAVVRATANAFGEALKRRRAIVPADLATIHQTRVAFKRFRYMMESLSPTITGLSKRQLRALAYYQRKMGIIQDLLVMQRCVACFLRENREAESALRPFCRYLKQRRTRALRSFLKSADDLLRFWPPARLAEPRNPAPALHAA